MSEEASQIAEERKEVKSKGERERYTQLNTDFQGLARKDKKAFLNEQCSLCVYFGDLTFVKDKRKLEHEIFHRS